MIRLWTIFSKSFCRSWWQITRIRIALGQIRKMRGRSPNVWSILDREIEKQLFHSKLFLVIYGKNYLEFFTGRPVLESEDSWPIGRGDEFRGWSVTWSPNKSDHFLKKKSRSEQFCWSIEDVIFDEIVGGDRLTREPLRAERVVT